MPRFSIDARRQLRPLVDADAGELYEVIEANRSHLARWTPWAAGQTSEGTLDFIRQAARQAADSQGFQLAVVVDDAIVGVIGFHRLDWEHRHTSIGYWIAEPLQGRGTITRATAALIDHALGVWELNRVEIRAGVENERSRAIPQRLGFNYEGTLRQVERVGARFVDHAVYSILAEEWTGSPMDEG